jgi:hypothetical protein
VSESREDALLGSMRRVTLDGPCPYCGAQPYVVDGSNPRPSADDKAFEASATTTCCKRRVGVLREERSSIFGAREDFEVLNGRARVYG